MSYQSMNPKWKDSFCTALRSGKYKQGRGCLRQSNGEDVWCCLGVLQDLVAPEEWITPENYRFNEKKWAVPVSNEEEENAGDISELQSNILTEVEISYEVMQILIRKNDGLINGPDHPRTEFFTFNEIANWIEANL